MNLPVKNLINASYEKDKLFVQDSASVKIYSVK